MKRLLALSLVLLLLAGCGQKQEESPETSMQQNQPDPGLYVADSQIEQATNGAIKLYDLPFDGVLWIKNIGSNLLVATKDGFTVLSGENCVVATTVTPEIPIHENMDDVQFTAYGLAYYLESTNEAVYLDQQLQPISRIELPEKPDSTPVVTQDGNEIFYCVGNEIRAYNTTLNVTRPVKTQLVKEQSLRKALFGGKVLSCNVVYDNGEQGLIYLDGQTGENKNTDITTSVLDTSDGSYFAVSDDGLHRQEIFGTLSTEPVALDIPDDLQLIPAVDMNGVVGVTFKKNKPVKLSMYDFRSGKITGEVKLAGVDKIVSACADKWSRCIWLLIEEKGITRLYRWDPQKSKTETDVSYLIPIYTPENPDEEGLATCQTRVKELNKTYGVEICIWKDAVSETDKYTVVPEHRTGVINTCLDELEEVFKLFPAKFLRKSATRPIKICVVRNVDGKTESVQFFKNKNAYIFLSVGSDLEEELIRGLGYVVNSRVVSNSPLLDTWTSLNPSGFAYGQANKEFLTGDDRAFADIKAMVSVVEDRSSIFRYAMSEGNEAVFASDTMQKKLELLCQGIRKVWKWTKEDVSYPWEQYLNKSLAYVKK